MAHAPVAADLDEALHVEGQVAAQVALYMAVMVDILAQLGSVILRQVAHADVGVYAGGGADVGSGLAADAEDIGERDLDTLISG